MKNLNDLKNHLVKMEQTEKEHKQAMLEEMATYVEFVAKGKFGEYQSLHGPFKRWKELADSTKKDRLNQGFSENEPLYRTGHLRDTIYHIVEGYTASIGSDDEIMAYQEFGTKKNGQEIIPARSVLGAALFQSKKAIQKIAKEGLNNWLSGKPPLKRKIIFTTE